MNRVITCPSGLQAEVRYLKGREINVFSDEEIMKSGKTIDTLLNACVSNIVDLGPYGARDGEFSWETALTGDRTYAAIQARVETFTEIVEWAVPCQNPSCDRAEYVAHIDLNKDLRINSLSAESTELFVAKKPFTVVLPKSGKTVHFHLQTGLDEQRANKVAAHEGNEGHQATLGLAIRIDGIKGETEDEDVHPNDTLRYLEDAHGADLVAITDAFEEADCQIDTTVPTVCPSCKQRRHRELPLASEAFWFPRASSRRTF